MNLATMLIIAALAIVAVLGVRSTLKRVNQGCCGSRDDVKIEAVKVEDRNKSHYPHEAVLSVDGMTCSHCAQRVENALNRLEGVYAKVTLNQGKADVLMKEKLDENSLRAAVNDLGPYTVMHVEWLRQDACR